MSSTKAHRFAAKYGKKFGGNLTLEGTISGRPVLDKITNAVSLGDSTAELESKLVYATGYLEYSFGKARKEGRDGITVKTAYVTGFAILDKMLYLITADSVYRITGPYYADVIKSDDILAGMWEDVKKQVLARASKNA